jgi:hypothetical protein
MGPTINTLSNVAIGAGYMAETFLKMNFGMKYIAPVSIAYQLYQGEYAAAAKSCAIIAGYALPAALIPAYSPLALTFKACVIAYESYDLYTDIYNDDITAPQILESPELLGLAFDNI